VVDGVAGVLGDDGVGGCGLSVNLVGQVFRSSGDGDV
jgi:hypothetical protein